MPKRLEVGYQYLDLCINYYPEYPAHQDLASLAKISKSYARKIIIELKNTGLLTDPEATNSEKGPRKSNNIIWTR
jgi:DNA-binding IscR family transcriptional regulator